MKQAATLSRQVLQVPVVSAIEQCFPADLDVVAVFMCRVSHSCVNQICCLAFLWRMRSNQAILALGQCRALHAPECE